MTISHNQNVAITMAKAFHVLATCLGDKDTIDNAQEHLDCACDNGLYDFEATRHATIAAMDALIRSTSADKDGLVAL